MKTETNSLVIKYHFFLTLEKSNTSIPDAKDIFSGEKAVYVGSRLETCFVLTFS